MREQRILGDTHPDTLKAMSDLALTYWERRNVNEAVNLLQKTMEGSQKTFGDDHPKTQKLGIIWKDWKNDSSFYSQ